MLLYFYSIAGARDFILSKLLFLAAFPVVAWKSGMLAPSAADTVTSACAATVDAIGRTYRGWSRRAFNQ